MPTSLEIRPDPTSSRDSVPALPHVPADRRSPPILSIEADRPIVVLKFSGMGTLLGVVPLLEGLRKQAPSADLVLVTDRHNAPLASRLLGLKTVLYREKTENALDFLAGVLALGHRIRAQSPGLFVDLQSRTFRRTARMLALASGAPVRLGFVGPHEPGRIGRPTHPVYRNPHLPLHVAMEQVAKALGIASLDGPGRMPPILTPTTTEREELLLAGLPPTDSSPILAINPHASDRGLERRWSARRFAEVAARLLRTRPSLRIVLTGLPGERPYTEEIASLVRSFASPGFPLRRARLVNAAGRLSLGGLIVLLDRAEALLTNDSGPLHLALCLRTPTVAIFGPTRPDLVLPAGPHPLHVLYGARDCSPCLYEVSPLPCGGTIPCLEEIESDRVFRAVDALLDQSSPSPPAPLIPIGRGGRSKEARRSPFSPP